MSEQQQEQNLMLGDRINYPYILAKALLTFQESVVKDEGERSDQEVREAALVVDSFIPDAWVKADKEYDIEKKAATTEREVDARKEYCGRKVGPPKIEKEEYTDPYKLLHASVNVFQRRGLLSKTIFTEKIVPTPEDFEKNGESNDAINENQQ